MYKRGWEFEKTMSERLHAKFTPVLISSKLLRKYGCGQVDIAYVEYGVINLVELKSSQIGVKNYFSQQYQRMMRTAKLITHLIRIPVKLKLIAKM